MMGGSMNEWELFSDRSFQQVVSNLQGDEIESLLSNPREFLEGRGVSVPQGEISATREPEDDIRAAAETKKICIIVKGVKLCWYP